MLETAIRRVTGTLLGKIFAGGAVLAVAGAIALGHGLMRTSVYGEAVATIFNFESRCQLIDLAKWGSVLNDDLSCAEALAMRETSEAGNPAVREHRYALLKFTTEAGTTEDARLFLGPPHEVTAKRGDRIPLFYERGNPQHIEPQVYGLTTPFALGMFIFGVLSVCMAQVLSRDRRNAHRDGMREEIGTLEAGVRQRLRRKAG